MDLKVQTKKLPKGKMWFSIEVPAEKMLEFESIAFNRLAPSITIEGFRPGKAPKHLIIDKLGKDRISSEALEVALPRTYYEAVTQNKIVPVTPPDVSIKQYEQEKPLIYEVTVSVMPEITLSDYKKIRIPKISVEILDKDVDDFILDIQKKRATLQETEKLIEKGLWAEIDFELLGDFDANIKEQLSSKKFPLVIGEAHFIEGFEDQLIGMKKGDHKELFVSPSAEFSVKEVAGKKISFKVNINEVKEVILPNITDDFVKSLGSFESILDFKMKLRENLLHDKEIRLGEQYRMEVVRQAIKEASVEIPEALISQEVTRLISDISHNVALQGLTFERYLELIHKTKEELEKDLSKQAEENVKTGLALNEIAKVEKIDISEEELKQEIDMILKTMPEREAEIKKIVENPEQKQRFINNVIGRKTVDFLVKIAQGSGN